ncbi:hypothetical protein CERSUDRAFT_116168 [Gelatoporia subvermispora B]|uniref:Uncharacterized protein n=1 Tax=Ceriporiopsis subvermispora (strain B) TaxID=914234 RepID=M2QEC3_CERS8|nr:hypothetical protein CERSUDRAFT_116168 [Gelatoporia subvermispora B]
MRFLYYLSFALTVPATVFACEGECIVSITNAFLGNYTKPLGAVLESAATQISGIMPNNPGASAVLHYMQPFIAAYKNTSYAGMETAIFPNYFHGKCLDENGNEPAGCPDPDCPIVCGTPGSLVHFYAKLRLIAYNQTRYSLKALVAPSSKVYQQVEQNILNAAGSESHVRRAGRLHPRQLLPGLGSASPASHASPLSVLTAPASMPNPLSGSSNPLALASALSPSPPTLSSDATNSTAGSDSKMVVPLFMKRTNNNSSSDDMKTQLRTIMQDMPDMLRRACGDDSADGTTNGLPNCSWEPEMKEYILSFP